MKTLFSVLKEVCTKYPLQEKVILVESHSAGRQLIQAYVKDGNTCVNLRTETIAGLAKDTCKFFLYNNKLSVIPNTLASYLMLGLLKKLSAEGKLKYFNTLKVSSGIAGALLNTINDLKMSGVACGDLKVDMFLNSNKGLDIKLIFSTYESMLKDSFYVDEADLYKIARQSLANKKHSPIYLLPANLRLKPLQQKFFESLVKDSPIIRLPITSPKGLALPKSYLLKAEKLDEETAESPLSRLYALEKVQGDQERLQVEILQAYGENNEVKAVIRKIKKAKLPLDQVAIFYTSPDPYLQLLFDLAQLYKLNITFGEGIAIKNTYPGRLFFGILAWIRSDYQVSKLYPLFNSEELMLAKGDAPSNFTLARLLRTSGIGWGRDRYLAQLEKHLENLDQEKEGYKEYLYLKALMSTIFNFLPKLNQDDQVNFSLFAQGLLNLMEHFSKVTDKADEKAKETIIQELKVLAEGLEEEAPLAEILHSLESIVEGIKVNSSSPKPGALHVDSYKKGLWVSRPYSFVVGLDAQRFPGQGREDAILLDEERNRISKGLALKKDHTKENLFEVVQLLASLPGNLTISYSAFDAVEGRELFPSTLLLQTYRLLEGDTTKDYSQLLASLTSKSGYVPKALEDVLDEAEWWLYQAFMAGGINKPKETVEACFTNFKAGLQAERNRLGQEVTIYDGKVKLDRKVVDPRLNPKKVLSCSQLETLAKCPYQYFLRYVLRLKQIEDTVYDPGVWLDPATRGNLLHRIFELFYKKLRARGEAPCLSSNENLLYKLADQEISKLKFELPPPSLVVFEAEYKEIIASCRVFLLSEEAEGQGSSPSYFELSFGLREQNDELGSIGPVAISLPSSKSFYLSGKIDRVDLASDGTFKAFDYKTGSTWGYTQNAYYKGGRQLQHTVFALALEKILLERKLHVAPEVSEGGYLFPTIKGEGQRIIRSQKDRQACFEILEELLNIMAEGPYLLTDEASECKYCKYIEVCERSLYEEAYKEKLKDSNNTELTSFRRLRTYG